MIRLTLGQLARKSFWSCQGRHPVLRSHDLPSFFLGWKLFRRILVALSLPTKLDTGGSRSVLGTSVSYRSQGIAGTHLAFTILLCSALFTDAKVSGFGGVVTLSVAVGLGGLCIARIALLIHHLSSSDLEGPTELF